MPIKIFKKFLGSADDKKIYAFEDMINQFEVEIEEKGMQIKNIAMSEVGQTGDAFLIIHYGPK